MSFFYRIVKHCFFLLVIFHACGLQATSLLIDLKDPGKIYREPSSYQLLLDNGHHYTPPQIQSDATLPWQVIPADFVFSPTEEYWFQFNIGAGETSRPWLLTPGLWHQAELYTEREDGAWTLSELNVFMPLEARMVPHKFPFYHFTPADKPLRFLLRVQGFRYGREASAQFPWIASEQKVLSEQSRERYIQGIYLGFAFGLAGFHLVLFFWSREKTYLWLVAAALTSPLFFHAFYGVGLVSLWPNFPAWDEYSAVILGGLTTAIYLRFGSSYLRLRQKMPKIAKIVNGCFFAIILSSGAAFYHPVNLLGLQAFLQAACALLIFVVAIQLSLRGVRYAWYFVAGNSLVLLVLVLWSLVETGIVPYAWLPVPLGRLMLLAASTQGILLALGMVGRMQLMRQEILRQELAREKLISLQERQTKKLMEAQNEVLSSKNMALKEIDELKDEFLAKTSHELNTPLNGIIGLSEVLLDDSYALSKEERHEYLEIIVARSEHLRDLVSELLQFAQTKNDTIKLSKEKLDLVEQVRRLTLSFAPAAKNKGLELVVRDHLEAKLSEKQKGSPLWVEADLRRIRQILAILIDNAIKYTDRGKVDVSFRQLKKQIEIRISDTGMGIDKSHWAAVFDPFKQIPDANMPRGGAGLGLSICQHLVALHHGSLELESELGRGSTFILKLPL